MFMTRELTHVRNMFLRGNLFSFDFVQDKLRIQVTYNVEPMRFNSKFFIQVSYNNCEAFNVDSYNTATECWTSIERTLNTLTEIVNEPDKALEERLLKMPWVNRELHENIINQIIGE